MTEATYLVSLTYNEIITLDVLVALSRNQQELLEHMEMANKLRRISEKLQAAGAMALMDMKAV